MTHGAILVAGERFAETGQRHCPWSERGEPRLECRADPRFARTTPPADTARAPLELIAANELSSAAAPIEIPKAGNQDAVGPAAYRRAILPPWNHAAGAASLDVIHDSQPQRSAAIGKPIWKGRRVGVEENPYALERRRTEKDDSSAKLVLRSRSRIDDANTGDAP